MKKIVLVTSLIGATAAGGWFFRAPILALFEDAPAASTETYVVRRGPLAELASASGTIVPHVQVEVKSRAAGEVIEVLVAEGDTVEVDQLLVRLDPTDAERAVAEAEIAVRRLTADLASARASVAIAEAQASQAASRHESRARGQGLGIVSSDEATSAATEATVSAETRAQRVAQVSGTRAQLDAARLAVTEARQRLAETEIRARIAGTVLSVAVERGSVVSSGMSNTAGGSALMTIADLSDLRVVGRIDESQIGKVQREQAVHVRVDAYPARVFEGRVERVASIGAAESNVVTFDVEIAVTDEDASLLRSGMSADVEIVTREVEDALLVPLMAVQTMGSRQSVTLTNGERAFVRTGATSGAMIEVVRGLDEGAEIALAAPPPRTSEAPERPRSALPGMGRGMRGRGGRS